ncbi:hypothetical protein [Pseudooceanicola sp.]|uniref:hypothetical protein n=1 Tax=Pseudooceanicola sp. TaxID=1914328 RepID=UPI0035C6DD1A
MAHQHYEYHTTEKPRSDSGLAFLVGALVVLVGVIAFVVFVGDYGIPQSSSNAPSVEINATADSAAGAEAADESTDGAAGAAAEADNGDAAAAAGASSTD